MTAKNNTTYFSKLNQTLQDHKRAIPCLVIDLDRLDQNITTLEKHLAPDMAFRTVVKSLPSPELLAYVNSRIKAQKYMVFHHPFLSDLSKRLDANADILLGKPMPVKTAAY